MALGPDIILAGSNTRSTTPVSITSGWSTVIDALGMDDVDAATITNPTTEIILSTRHRLHRKGIGTTLLLRMGYDDGLTSITDPVVKVFGKTGTSEIWTLLKSNAPALTGTLTTALTTDVTDGTYLYTTPDPIALGWDCLGCDYLLVGIQTALAGTGTVTNAFLQAKIV